MAAARQPTDTLGTGAVKLQLLGSFAVLVAGQAVAVPPAGQRVLARLALGGGTATRSAVAGTLWPDHPEPRAQANLRGAVWRLPAEVRERLVLGTSTLGLGEAWRVDVTIAEGLARESVAPGPPARARAELFRHDLLPDWDEPWLMVERERYRQLRLHALEDLARWARWTAPCWPWQPSRCGRARRRCCCGGTWPRATGPRRWPATPASGPCWPRSWA